MCKLSWNFSKYSILSWSINELTRYSYQDLLTNNLSGHKVTWHSKWTCLSIWTNCGYKLFFIIYDILVQVESQGHHILYPLLNWNILSLRPWPQTLESQVKLGQVTSRIPEMTFSLDDWNKASKSYLYNIIFNGLINSIRNQCLYIVVCHLFCLSLSRPLDSV